MIPVYVNVFNRLTTTRDLVAQIAAFKDAEPIIIDNASTYVPLLEWYETMPCDIVHLRENMGHHAPWRCGVIQQDASPVYGVTDCDLNLKGIPLDAMEVLQVPFTWTTGRPYKCGFGLRINDLPPWQTNVIQWEIQFWKHRIHHDRRFYRAEIDTTFALYQLTTPIHIATDAGVESVRTGGRYIARHMPWYLDGENLDEENKNYFATANRSNSWRPDGRSLSSVHMG